MLLAVGAPAPAHAAETHAAEIHAAEIHAAETRAAETRGVEKKVKIGVFRGTSPGEVDAFGNWLNRDVQYAVDFSSRTTWKVIGYVVGVVDGRGWAWQF